MVQALLSADVFNREGALDLLKAGADIKTRGPGGATVLHLAVRMPDSEAWFVKRLLKLGADPTAVDDAGETPLQEAQRLDKAEVAEILGQAKGREPIAD